MFINLILLVLFAGIPYFLFFEKTKKLTPERIFFLSTALILIGMLLSSFINVEQSTPLVIISLASAMFAFHKASQSTNFYKFSYYMLFVNAPVLMMFPLHRSAPYFLALIVTLIGIYFIGRHYKQNYGSANYQPVTGIIVSTPFVGGFLTLYLITLALYPPFPRAMFFLHAIFEADITALWYLVVLFIFFANFILAMRIMGKTVFGKTNSNIHYVEFDPQEKIIHFIVFIALFMLTIWEFKEIF